MIRYTVLGLLLVTTPAVGGLGLSFAHDSVFEVEARHAAPLHLGNARVSEPTVLLSVAPESRVVSTRPAADTEIDWGENWGRPIADDAGGDRAVTETAAMIPRAPAASPRPAPRGGALAPDQAIAEAGTAPASGWVKQMASAIPLPALRSPGADATPALSGKTVATASAMSERGLSPAPRFLVGVYR